MVSRLNWFNQNSGIHLLKHQFSMLKSRRVSSERSDSVTTLDNYFQFPELKFLRLRRSTLSLFSRILIDSWLNSSINNLLISLWFIWFETWNLRNHTKNLILNMKFNKKEFEIRFPYFYWMKFEIIVGFPGGDEHCLFYYLLNREYEETSNVNSLSTMPPKTDEMKITVIIQFSFFSSWTPFFRSKTWLSNMSNWLKDPVISSMSSVIFIW